MTFPTSTSTTKLMGFSASISCVFTTLTAVQTSRDLTRVFFDGRRNSLLRLRFRRFNRAELMAILPHYAYNRALSGKTLGQRLPRSLSTWRSTMFKRTHLLSVAMMALSGLLGYGAAMVAASSWITSLSDECFGVAGEQFHSGCEARLQILGLYTSVTLSP